MAKFIQHGDSLINIDLVKTVEYTPKTDEELASLKIIFELAQKTSDNKVTYAQQIYLEDTPDSPEATEMWNKLRELV
jgi:hypothetical protein